MSFSETPGEARFPLTNNAPAPVTPQAQPPASKPPVRSARPRRFWPVVGRIFAVGFCLAMMFTGAVLGNFSLRSKFFGEIIRGLFINPAAVIWHRDPLVNFTPDRTLPADKQHIVNILLLGIDRSYKTVFLRDKSGRLARDRHGNPIKSTEVDESNKRSDAILIARMDFDTKQVSILSVPRDTAVHIPGRRRAEKINAAFSFGGPALAQETVKQTFGLATDYYVAFDFDAFKDMVDAIGGVELTVDKRLKYDDNYGGLHIDLQPGLQHLNGEQAIGFVRMRKDSSDVVRTQRQQAFLEAVRARAKQPSTLAKVPNVLNALTDNIETNMTPDQMLTLANFARKLPRKDVQLATLPVIMGRRDVYVNQDESAGLIRRLFFAGANVPVVINAPSRTEVASTGEGRRRRRRPRRASQSATRTETPSEETQTSEAAPAVNPEPGPPSPPPGSGGTEPPTTGGGESGGTTGGGADMGRSSGGATSPAVREIPLAAGGGMA